jgi:glycogen debranching enzyme
MIKKTLSSALRKSRSGARLLTVRSLVLNGYLKDKGWMDSVAQSMPVDGNGGPIPWYTYGAIDFLSGRIRATTCRCSSTAAGIRRSGGVRARGGS